MGHVGSDVTVDTFHDDAVSPAQARRSGAGRQSATYPGGIAFPLLTRVEFTVLTSVLTPQSRQFS
jgi:hypothetical protein